MVTQDLVVDSASKSMTSIAVWKSTKDKLDRNRAPGQCYNGFIRQLIDLWEEAGRETMSIKAGSTGENQGAKGSAIPC